ncbi:MAG: FtsX-like permease family protein [Fulvivirga sp.]|uniref:FtsX-like permease family protein n=1 Tax=Fulvivirga sp. TaxID=1931237 RepID=UPI0032EB7E8D
MSNGRRSILPPKLASSILEWFLKDDLAEEVLGDLDENFYRTIKKKNKSKAKFQYWYQTLNYLRPFALKKIRSNSNNTTMYQHNIKIAFRHLAKNKGYSFINIFSLTIGLAACMAIFLFIKDETSFDSFHTKRDSIYRLCEIQNFTGTKEQKVALSMPGMGPQMLNDFPEVINYTRYYVQGKRYFTKGETGHTIDKVFLVDSTFLDMFDFKLIAGDRATALNEPGNILLTFETASKFFPISEEAIGSTINMGDRNFKITGILADAPENSHMQFDAIGSITTITSENPDFNDEFGSNYVNTYLRLVNTGDAKALEAKFDDFLVRHMGENSEDREVLDYYELFLQPLNEVHLGSMDIEHDYNNYRKFNGTYIDTFKLVGFFILIIACINFMNLTIARASQRWKEVGVRKAIGSLKQQLFHQFVIESVVLSLLALAIAFIINLAFIPFLNDLLERQLSIITFFQEPITLVISVLIAILLGVVTGLYPALYMTSVNVIAALKGNAAKGNKSAFRSALVILQFGLALAMIVSTFVVLQQLNFMQSKDVGFVKDKIVLIDMNREANESFQTMKDELLNLSSVSGVTASGQRLGNNFHQWGFKVKTDTGIYNMTPSNVHVEHDYLDVYQIKLKEGRSFNKDITSDEGLAYIINDKLAKELNLKTPINTEAAHSWFPDDSLGSIIGVTEDFNFNSLHHRVNTLVISVHTNWGFDEMSVKIKGDNIQAALADIENIWSKHVQEWPFDYQFLDEHFNTMYKSDQQMSSIVSIMTVLAILIACVGLFGLSSIMILRRIKEVGIRKTLGASIAQIVMLLSKNFLLLIGIAFLIASPITFIVMSGWLENFAFQIDISLWLFVLGGLVSLAIGFFTISFHIIKAAKGNPVSALKTE